MHEHLHLTAAHLLKALIRYEGKKVQIQSTTWQQLRLTDGRAHSAVAHQPTPQRANRSPSLRMLRMQAPILPVLASCLNFLLALETLT